MSDDPNEYLDKAVIEFVNGHIQPLEYVAMKMPLGLQPTREEALAAIAELKEMMAKYLDAHFGKGHYTITKSYEQLTQPVDWDAPYNARHSVIVKLLEVPHE